MNLVEKIEAAGVVGCGGAGFPTHRKLSGSFEYLIANGAECEPLLRHDRWLMRNKASEIVQAMDAIGAELNIPNLVVALKGHYHAEAEAIEAAAAKLGSKVRVHRMESFYPAGDEQTMVYEVTGRVVPPAGIPAEVGAVVDNAKSLAGYFSMFQMHDPVTKTASPYGFITILSTTAWQTFSSRDIAGSRFAIISTHSRSIADVTVWIAAFITSRFEQK